MGYELDGGDTAVGFERIRECPAFLDIYGNTEVTIYGITGTLSELAALCTADDSTRTEEANNRFVIAAMNEAGAEILPEHESYFLEEIERKGLEPKIQIREEQPLEASKLSREKEALINVSAIKNEVSSVHVIPIERIEDANVERNLYKKADASFMEQEAAPVIPPAPEVSLEVRNQLSSLFDESASKSHKSLVSDRPTSPEYRRHTKNSADIEAPKTEALRDGLLDFQHADLLYEENSAILSAPEIEVVNFQEAAGEQHVLPRTTAPDVAERIIYPSHDECEVELSEEKITVKNRVGVVGIEEEIEMPPLQTVDAGDRVDTEDKKVLPDELVNDQEVLVTVPDTLTVLLESLHREEISEHENMAMQEEKQAAYATEFIEAFVVQVYALPEDQHSSPEQQPAIILENIIETAFLVQQLQETEAEPQEIEQVKEELTELCKQLFESMGIEADEKTIALFVEKILISDLSRITQKKLTPRELARLGTREYKLEEWFHKFKQLLDDRIHPHQVMGRLALRLNMGLAF
jgi:hypothetical protein